MLYAKRCILLLAKVAAFSASAMPIEKIPDDARMYTCNLTGENKVNRSPPSRFTSAFIHSDKAEKIWWYRGEADIEDMESIRYSNNQDFYLYEARRTTGGNIFRFLINSGNNEIYISEYSARLKRNILEWSGKCHASKDIPKREVYEKVESIDPRNLPANIFGFVCNAFSDSFGTMEIMKLSYIILPQKKEIYMYKERAFSKINGHVSINGGVFNVIQFEIYSDRARKHETTIDTVSGNLRLEWLDTKNDLNPTQTPMPNALNVKVRGSCKRTVDLEQ